MFIESDITDTDVIPVRVKVHCVDNFIFVFQIYITKHQIYYEHNNCRKMVVSAQIHGTWTLRLTFIPRTLRFPYLHGQEFD